MTAQERSAVETGRDAIMEQIAQELENLSESPLYADRKKFGYKVVVGEGDLHARLMFIGEAPGAQEAKTGRPFVGASGRVLDELLASIDLERSKVYITNVVKDRPPENRDPRPEEIALYKPFLLRQIALIQPRVIASLGRFAMDFVLETFGLPQQGQKISELHGQTLEVQAEFGRLVFVPLFHPAVALYARNQRESMEKDFQVLQQYL